MTTFESLQRFGPKEFEGRLDDAIAVYKAAFLDLHEPDPARAARERRAHAQRCLTRPGFVGVAAVGPTDRMLGMGYATLGAPGQWWHDVVSAALGASGTTRWLSSVLEVVELHVRPERQGAGLGRRLLHELVRGSTAKTTALSALDTPGSPALRLYASVGYRPLLTGFTFPGTPVTYQVLAADLPLAETR